MTNYHVEIPDYPWDWTAEVNRQEWEHLAKKKTTEEQNHFYLCYHKFPENSEAANLGLRMVVPVALP